jgi:hypothetical protein
MEKQPPVHQVKLKTPNYDLKNFHEVYEPGILNLLLFVANCAAEDTFILLDALGL